MPLLRPLILLTLQLLCASHNDMSPVLLSSIKAVYSSAVKQCPKTPILFHVHNLFCKMYGVDLPEMMGFWVWWEITMAPIVGKITSKRCLSSVQALWAAALPAGSPGDLPRGWASSALGCNSPQTHPTLTQCRAYRQQHGQDFPHLMNSSTTSKHLRGFQMPCEHLLPPLDEHLASKF